jgi:hypothetical protein
MCATKVIATICSIATNETGVLELVLELLSNFFLQIA